MSTAGRQTIRPDRQGRNVTNVGEQLVTCDTVCILLSAYRHLPNVPDFTMQQVSAPLILRSFYAVASSGQHLRK